MSRITRRRALGVAAGAVAGLAVTGTAVARTAGTAGGADHTGHAGHTGNSGKAPADPAPFDEMYEGRHIQGGPTDGHGGHGGHGGGHSTGYTVRIDGEELHVMRNADGTWISVINHYEPLATPLATARAAVRELQGAPLVPLTLV
ncbi:tyrosinase cofactor [Streptomyces sp. LP05-1]|uniref:Tyrosinase cofactor n=1 Tax=Streptomyces pyxinae TaxID=2970734 RepID=A0ABT2CBA4_9ACTN|nr:tyrosinase cofactor [Streptomyces sp. LP05-1]MCS0634683.1 tyrosinase cofactor [Streptomyces sp. LP05-1]